MKLTIEENRVVFEQDPKNKWTLEIDKIKFIGEYTTDGGPIADDYFFVFADTVDKWWQAPTLSVDHEQFWKELGQRLKSEIAVIENPPSIRVLCYNIHHANPPSKYRSRSC